MCNRYLIACALVFSALLYGCSGSSVPVPDNRPQFNGPGMPVATPDDIEITEDGKIASASYFKFFADSVNQHSAGRWSTVNDNGYKQWMLSNTAASAPKSWLMGANYYNNEYDVLGSNDFTVPDQTAGVRITFKARWQIAANDDLEVVYQVDGSPEIITTFTDGQNPDYPGYTKYYFELPDNFSGLDTTNNVVFYFSSNGSGNGFGASIDDVAVYQRRLGIPLTLDATDGLLFNIEVSWSHNNQGTLIPDEYWIYRADDEGGSPGTYAFLDSVTYPSNQYFDSPPQPFDDYWYKVIAVKTGYPDSPYSNEDTGWYDSI